MKAVWELSLTSQLNKIFFVWLLTLLMWGNLSAQSNLIALHTSEFSQFRRLLIHIPQNNANVLTLPTFKENPAAGKIQITIYDIEENRYLGPSLIKETGAYPTRIKIEFPQSKTMQITVETIPYQYLSAFNVFGSEQFIFDIYKYMPSETMLLEKSVSLFPGAAASEDMPQSSRSLELSLVGKVRYFMLKHGSGRIMDAFYYSGLIIIVLTFLGIIWLFLKKKNAPPAQPAIPKAAKKRKEAVTPVPSPKVAVPQVTPAPESPFVPLTPADKENMIRELMQKEGISYDEATILVSLSKGKLNVSV